MTRAISILSAAVLLLVSTVCAGAEKSALTVGISVPSNEKGERWIVYRMSSQRTRLDIGNYFPVVITNVSDKPIRLWENWNSWGHDNLTFEITTKDGKKSWARSARSTWTINVASYYELAPGESSTVPITFTDDYYWSGFPIGVTGSDETVTIQVHLTISPTKESAEKGVWTGSIDSAAQKYRFLHDR